MTVGPPSPRPARAPVHSDLARAGRGFVLVFVGGLMFFGFVIGSELLGAVGQASLAFVFASGALLVGWFRTDRGTRRRLVLEVRHVVRPSSRG